MKAVLFFLQGARKYRLERTMEISVQETFFYGKLRPIDFGLLQLVKPKKFNTSTKEWQASLLVKPVFAWWGSCSCLLSAVL